MQLLIRHRTYIDHVFKCDRGLGSQHDQAHGKTSCLTNHCIISGVKVFLQQFIGLCRKREGQRLGVRQFKTSGVTKTTHRETQQDNITQFKVRREERKVQMDGKAKKEQRRLRNGGCPAHNGGRKTAEIQSVDTQTLVGCSHCSQTKS